MDTTRMTRRGFGAALGAAAGAVVLRAGTGAGHGRGEHRARPACRRDPAQLEREPVRALRRRARGGGPLARRRRPLPRRSGGRAAGRGGEGAWRRVRANPARLRLERHPAHGRSRRSSGPAGRWSPPSRRSRPCSPTTASPARAPSRCPLDGAFRHDLQRMAAACDAATGLVYICNPNNPTGTVVTGEELAAFLARVPAIGHRARSTRPTTTSSSSRGTAAARTSSPPTRT